jgi:hypothetical protein
MSKEIGKTALLIIQKICAVLFRMALFIIAWCFKLASRVTDKIGDELLKLSEK